MKVSLVIILVNYNGFSDTKACLESIKKTQGEFPFVVLIDNASKDADVLDELPGFYPRLHIIKSPQNLGFGRANNLGIKWAHDNLDFEFLLLLNNDTLVEPECFNHLKEAFKKDLDIGITTGKTMYESNREIVWYGGGDVNFRRGWPKIADYNQRPKEEGANKARFVSFVSGCVMMFSKESIEVLEGFDDEFFMYCEDLELSIRAQKKGYKLFYEPKSIIYHKVQGSTKTSHEEPTGLKPGNSNSPFLFFHMKSNQWISYKKHLQKNDWIIFSFYFWLEFYYKIAVYLLHGKWNMLKVGFLTSKRIFYYSLNRRNGVSIQQNDANI